MMSLDTALLGQTVDFGPQSAHRAVHAGDISVIVGFVSLSRVGSTVFGRRAIGSVGGAEQDDGQERLLRRRLFADELEGLCSALPALRR